MVDKMDIGMAKLSRSCSIKKSACPFCGKQGFGLEFDDAEGYSSDFICKNCMKKAIKEIDKKSISSKIIGI